MRPISSDHDIDTLLDPIDPKDAAAYIECICWELSQLADQTGHRLLTYVLTVAAQEAGVSARRRPDRSSGGLN